MSLTRLTIAVGVASAFLVNVGCSADQQPSPPRQPAAHVEPLHRGPLSDFVPAPSLRWLMLAEPRALARTKGLLELVEPLLPRQAFEAFSERNGFDLRQTSSALVAGFDFGTLYIVPEEGQADRITERFVDRLLRSDKVARPHPQLTRITGIAGTTPESLLKADGQLVAIAVDNPTLVRLVEGYLLERFRKTPPALRGSSLASIASFGEGAPLRVFFPGPFSKEDVPGALQNSVLAPATAAAVAVSFRDVARNVAPATPGLEGNDPPPHDAKLLAVVVRIVLSGDYSEDPGASLRLSEAWTSITSTASARWFGLDEPLGPPAVSSSADRLELETSYDAARFLGALHGALRGELRDLFPPRDDDPSSVDASPRGAPVTSRETRETGKDSRPFRDP